MSITNIIKLLGGVALFLYGMSLMGDCLKKVAGSKLELFLYKITGNPIKGILLGTIVTAIIQSSSATSAMVVGFVNSGMMKVKQAIGVIMGAIIGTSITGWIISLSYIGNGSTGIFELLSADNLAAIVGIVGIVIIMVSKNRKAKDAAGIMMGFAILMVGMQTMSSSVSGLRTNEAFINMITSFTNPLIGVLIGAAFTAVIQSASAAVGIIQALSTTGVMKFDMVLPITMGIAIGASVPVIISSIGASVAGKRSALSYLVIDTVGALVFGILFYSINAFVHFSFLNVYSNPVTIALLNTIFRVIMIILLAPFIKLIEKMVSLIIKDEPDDGSYDGVNQLEERFLAYPPLAVEHVSLAMKAMAEKVQITLVEAINSIGDYSDKKYANIDKQETIIDEYEDKVSTYLTKITANQLDDYQSQTVGRYLHSVTDLERISDHSLNIAQCANKIADEKIKFTDESKKELDVVYAAIEEVMNITVDSFINTDIAEASKVESLEEVIDELTDELKANHVKRLQKGECTIANGYVFNDLLTNFERISDHCSNIALATIGLGQENFDPHIYEQDVLKNIEKDKVYQAYKEKYKI